MSNRLASVLSVLIISLFFASSVLAQPFAYVNNALEDTVSVIDTVSNTVIDTIMVGSGPFGVAITPDGTRAYVTNGSSDTVSVIDTASIMVVDTITVGNTPLGLAIGPPPLPRNIPTLSKWGLIAMAGILGIIGFIVIRRKKVAS